MNDFKDAYQSAVHDMDIHGINEFHIDVSDCMDVKKHNRRMLKRMRRVTTTAFSAMCVVFICGFGTAKAAGYIHNVIKVSERGFESADVVTMARNGEERNRSYVIDEQIDEAISATEILPESAAALEETTGAEAVKETDGIKNDRSKAAAGGSISGNSVSDNAVSGNFGVNAPVSDTFDADTPDADASVSVNSSEGETAKPEDIPVFHYASFDEFAKNEDIIFPQPSISIGKQIAATDITVCGDWAMVRYEVDGRVLWIERTDYGNTNGHTSSKIFPGGVCNERAYTTPAGETYTLVDSVKEGEEEALQIHAAITAGSYEVYIDFMDFEEAEAKKIVDSIDLSFYK